MNNENFEVGIIEWGLWNNGITISLGVLFGQDDETNLERVSFIYCLIS